MFGVKVETSTTRVIHPDILARTRIGIKKRIRQEKNRYAASNDPAYKLKRLDNIRRLEIIKKEIKELEDQL